MSDVQCLNYQKLLLHTAFEPISSIMLNFQVAFKKNEDEYDTKQTATSRSNFDSVASDSYKVTETQLILSKNGLRISYHNFFLGHIINLTI